MATGALRSLGESEGGESGDDKNESELFHGGRDCNICLQTKTPRIYTDKHGSETGSVKIREPSSPCDVARGRRVS